MPSGTLILCRHAPAGKPDSKVWPDDSARPVTRKATKQMVKAAQGLKNLTKPPTRVLTSQAARCIQTASLLEWDAGWPPAVAYDVLDDGHSVTSVLNDVQAIKEWPCVVALVGHGPSLAELAAWLVPGYDSDQNIDKGGVVKISVGRKLKPGSGKLDWQMTMKELKEHR